MGKYLPGGSEQNRPRRPLPRAVATAAVEPPPRARSSVPPEPPRAWIRCPTSSSPPLPRIPSRSRSVSTANPNPNTTVSVLAVDPPLPELQAAIAKSPPQGAAPRPPLRPRQAVQAGVAASRRPRRFTVHPSSSLHHRLRRRQASPCLSEHPSVFVVRLRSRLTPLPSRFLSVSSTRSPFCSAAVPCRRTTVRL